MSRYFLVVLVVFGCILHGTAQEKPQKPEKPVRMPVIDCVVEYAHGDFGSHVPLSSGDRLTLNLNALDKISFDLPQGGPFLVKSTRLDPFFQKRDWFLMKLVSSGPDPRVTIYFKRGSRDCEPAVEHMICLQPTNDYEITVITETAGHFLGIAVLNGTATD
jgi:hypothetical protein